MVTVNEAKEKIIANTHLLEVESRALSDASGYVLAEDIKAPISLPSFRQSSMDGYAIIHADVVKEGTYLQITAEVRAGQPNVPVLIKGTAIRIFTGAPVPEEATAVVMQEHTEVIEGDIVIYEYPVSEGKNIRNVGQQIREGAIALRQGTVLSPGSIGFLQGMNVTTVKVYRKPKVGLLITGDELLKPGNEPEAGKVYESNSAMLMAALAKEGIDNVDIRYSKDDLSSTINALEELYANYDVILASGGISVGDYDFVGAALRELQAETIFYKVRQKPGKPLLFAKAGQKLFFALPGNPASSLVCYYEYVFPAIRKMTGASSPFLPTIMLPIKLGYTFDGERDEFLKAIVEGGEVVPLDGQESFALRSFAIANALIYLPTHQNRVLPGDLVEVHLLPF
jgi:molybdopterin molybdotransferase